MKLEAVKCPQCGGPMKSRQNKSSGQRFWGCMAFPRCKGTRDVNGDSAEDRRRNRPDFTNEEDDGPDPSGF